MMAEDFRRDLLDPVTFPLHGSRLIEASAGTGKTFTIALLYVRLVLGHAPIAAFPRGLAPRDILVVTFTEAATKELRDRIRSRLAEAARIFRAAAEIGDGQVDIGSDPLYAVRQSYPADQWGACARRLELAAESMDEAAVHTIHSWCYRMLREHAFDSGGLFRQTLETDHSELFMEVVRDYWRTFVYPLSFASAVGYLNLFRSPEDLLVGIRSLMGTETPGDATDNPLAPGDYLDPVMAERQHIFGELRAGIVAWATDFRTQFEQARAAKNIDGRKIRADNLDNWLGMLHEWAESDALEFPPLTPPAWHRLSPAGVEEAWKAGAPVDHPLMEAIAQLDEQREAAIKPEICLRHGAWWCARRIEAEKQRRAEMGFNDLLTRLDQALQSATGGHLAETIRNQFPVGLIDEFQDTDPIQYRIFATVFGINRSTDEPPQSGFFMIGDPKQAIYGFRGADIHTYLQARAATAGQHYTLATNYRSARAMVAASNQVFAFAEAHAPRAAFLFGNVSTVNNSGTNPLPFDPVVAKGRKEKLLINDEAPPAMTIWQGGDIDSNKATAVAAIAEGTASEITRLLNLGRDGRAGFLQENGVSRDLHSADIAVLVNTGQEASAVRQALSHRGVRSVYLSDRASVLETGQAFDVLMWMRACAEPERERFLRAALATGTLGLGWARLDHLRRDELAWEAEIEAFRVLRTIWQTQGVLAMIRRLLNRFDVPARLLIDQQVAGEGERALTDLLHIAELLQQESQHLDGEHALIRHFHDMLTTPIMDPGSRQVRLESDDRLVQVVTVHKSKGLEYPLVFLPFATACKPVTGKRGAVTWHDEQGVPHLTHDPDEEVLARADQERLGEDIRKLYVALTRARHATWVGACRLDKNLDASALAYLVGAGPAATNGFDAQLAALADDCPEISVSPLPVPAAEAYTPPPESALGEARQAAPRSTMPWWIASYSAIRYQQVSQSSESTDSGLLNEPETAMAERLQEEGSDITQAATVFGANPIESAPQPLAQPNVQTRRLHRFYRGAGPGTFLHGILEWAAEQGFGWVTDHPDQLQTHLQSRCAARGWQGWTQPLVNWTLDFLETPLPLPPLPDGQKSELVLDQCRVTYPEMEFWFAANHVNVAQLDALVQGATLDGAWRPQVQPMHLHGMLKGFIDLVLEHDGRYYVMDYKSNYLGQRDQDYSLANLAAAVAAKRYDLQYAIYLLALHRLLRSRLPEYDYDRHIGGAIYSFLRGNGGPVCGVFAERPPRAMIESLDQLLRGRDARNHNESGGVAL